MRAFFTGIVFFLLAATSFAGGKAFHFFTSNATNYDVIYHRISFSVDPGASAKINNGSVTTYFRTTVANVSSIDFDLDGAMTVSSATYHGSVITANQNTTTDILTLTIPSIAAVGTLDSVTVNYSGTPIIAAMSGVPSGYNYQKHGSGAAAQYAIFTLDEPYTAHNWWPCKESLYDKIDSCVELIVTTPNTYKVAGNGMVTEVASGSNTITTWKTFYPMATYGVNFAVGNYQNYQFTINTGGKSLPVMNYLYAEDFNATYKGYVDEMKKIIPMYVSVFGVDYPFLNEKYGTAECYPTWGALEVPSMTFVASDAYDKYTLAHEAAHQWFGDMVTTNSWHQIWLNEGFAKYCETVIFPENLYPSELAAKRSGLKSSVSTLGYTTYVSDTSTPNNIFIGASTEPYEKGAMILSMLRTWLGDSKFFAALKNYMTAPGIMHGFTAVDSLKKYMQAQTPVDLTDFFADWVYQKGRVTYTVKYQNVANGIYIQLTSQSRTAAGVPYFDTPVPIQIKNASGLDTTVVIIDKGGVLYNSVTGNTYGGNTIYYNLSATPSGTPVFDPNSLVLATGSFSSSTTLNTMIVLPVKDIKFDVKKNNKSEANLSWKIKTDEALQSIVIEKSTDAVHFTSFKNFYSLKKEEDYAGNTTDEILSAVQYYRLKILNGDGSFVYSPIKKIELESLKEFHLAPNPVINQLNMFLPVGFNDGEVGVLIRNISGQVIRQTLFSSNNESKINIPVYDFKPGNYNVLITNGKKNRLQANFIKQ